jgi:hypothetical protein
MVLTFSDTAFFFFPPDVDCLLRFCNIASRRAVRSLSVRILCFLVILTGIDVVDDATEDATSLRATASKILDGIIVVLPSFIPVH